MGEQATVAVEIKDDEEADKQIDGHTERKRGRKDSEKTREKKGKLFLYRCLLEIPCRLLKKSVELLSEYPPSYSDFRISWNKYRTKQVLTTFSSTLTLIVRSSFRIHSKFSISRPNSIYLKK